LVVIDRDGLLSCYPGVGDLYLHETWELHEGTRVKKIADPSVWKERRLSKPANLITIHYHRYDQDYDDVGIWTWDGHGKKAPEQNELFEVGRDDFGLIFQLDLADYGETGEADRIGLLPRWAGD